LLIIRPAAAEILYSTITRDIKKDTTELKGDMSDIKQDPTAIKQDTADILTLISKLKNLQRDRPQARDNFMLQRYLDELTTYAETTYQESVMYRTNDAWRTEEDDTWSRDRSTPVQLSAETGVDLTSHSHILHDDISGSTANAWPDPEQSIAHFFPKRQSGSTMDSLKTNPASPTYEKEQYAHSIPRKYHSSSTIPGLNKIETASSGSENERPLPSVPSRHPSVSTVLSTSSSFPL
jgi:hypothetical protein